MENISFRKVLELFELNHWVLQKLWSNYRVFIDPNDKDKLPWLIPVDDNKEVSIDYYLKIKEFFENGADNSKKS